MKSTRTGKAGFIISDPEEFLRFLKARYRIIHRSNFFFRDLHYGVMLYCSSHGLKVRYGEGEEIARTVAGVLEEKGIFRKVDHQSWLVNYPAFEVPRNEKKAA